MFIFEFIGEIVGQVIVETFIYRFPVEIYEWITGKEARINGYRTEQRKFIKFSVAKKFLVTWETDLDHLKFKLTEGLELMNEKLKSYDFQFVVLGDKTIIQPPASISFYSFHFLIQSLAEHKIRTVGVVETLRTIYTTYNDPNSVNLIGQTDKGKKFFITLMEDYSKRQFLRINRDIVTSEDFDVSKIKTDYKERAVRRDLQHKL
jgi:hypothetical protein